MRALADADTPELATACLSHGAWPSVPMPFVDPAVLPIGVGSDEHLHDTDGVRAWVAAVRLCAADPARIDATLDSELRRVDGPGWYRCWFDSFSPSRGWTLPAARGRWGTCVAPLPNSRRTPIPFAGSHARATSGQSAT